MANTTSANAAVVGILGAEEFALELTGSCW